MSPKLLPELEAAEATDPLLIAFSEGDSFSDAPPSYTSFSRQSSTSGPTWSDTRCESALRPQGPFVKNTFPSRGRSTKQGPAPLGRESTRPRAVTAPPSSASQLEAGTSSMNVTFQSRLRSTFDKTTLELCALAVCGLTCAAPTYSILVQSIGLWIFRPEVAPWDSLKISALMFPAILGGFILTIVLFVPILFLTVWIGAVKWNVPYGFILANIPIIVAAAILPTYSMPEGFTIVHAGKLALWGLVPPVFVMGVYGCFGLVVAGVLAFH